MPDPRGSFCFRLLVPELPSAKVSARLPLLRLVDAMPDITTRKAYNYLFDLFFIILLSSFVAPIYFAICFHYRMVLLGALMVKV